MGAEGTGYLYHATLPQHLDDIQREGLRPNRDRPTNWGGDLGRLSRGRLFVVDSEALAVGYSALLRGNQGRSHLDVILRFPADALAETEADPSDRYALRTEETVYPSDIEVRIDGEWTPIRSVRDFSGRFEPGAAYGEDDGSDPAYDEDDCGCGEDDEDFAPGLRY